MKKFRTLVVALLALTIVSVPALSTDAVAKKKKKPAPKALKITKGSVSLTFDPSFVQTLITNGVVPSAIAPGTLDASTFTLKLPIASGTVDKTGKNATLKLKGGEDLTKSSTQTTRTVTNLVVKIKSGKVTVTGDAGDGTTVVLPGAPFLNGTGSGTKTNKKFTFTVKSVTITPEAAADLNAQFGTTVAAGTPVGTGKVSAAK